MEMTETRVIRAAPEVVWAALLDPRVLQQAVPGCDSLTGSAEEGFEAEVTQKVGPVKARFTGLVTISDRIEGESLTLSGEGKGGAAGFAKGGAKVRLEPIAEGTALHYEVEARVGGKLAQLGSRIIDGFARKMADEFFSRFADAIEEPLEAEGEGEASSEGEGQAQKSGWFKRMLGR